MQKLLEKLNIEWDINEFLHYSDLENTLINRYNNYWFNNVNKETKRDGKGNKLRTYKLFKHQINFEKYLDNIKNII